MTLRFSTGTGLNWGQFFDTEIHPRLTADCVFTDPSHKWHKTASKWQGGCPWHESESGTAFYVEVGTLRWRCPACNVGGGPIQYLWKLQRGANVPSPRGADFVALVRSLADLVGVPIPEGRCDPATQEHHRKLETRRAVLESVYSLCQKALASSLPKAVAARAYLEERWKFMPEELTALEMGFYPCRSSILNDELKRLGHSKEDVDEATVIIDNLAGYIVFPWRDGRGRPLNLYGTWVGRTPPVGMAKKVSLYNPKDKDRQAWLQTKSSPYCLDRALRDGHRDLVLVEGLSDAAVAQMRGDTRVVSCVGPTLSEGQIQALQAAQTRSVTIVLDPDASGDTNTPSNVRRLSAVGITPYVAPRLPPKVDPDELIAEHGIDGWKAHVARKQHGFRHLTETIIGSMGERLPGDDSWSDDLVERVLAEARGLSGVRPDELKAYFLDPLAEATDRNVDDLAARFGNPPAGSPDEAGKPTGSSAKPTFDGYFFDAIDSPTFFGNDYRADWLVWGVLARGMRGVCGGPKKCLKTTTMIDLAVSLAGEKPFLGHFRVYRPNRVLIASAESGEATLQSTALRVCKARGLDPVTLPVWWSFLLPQFGNPTDVAAFGEGLRSLGDSGVCILDPLYLALLGGTDPGQVEAGNLYHIGPLLLGISQQCLNVGWTPILCHHTKKHTDRELRPMDLDDLSMAGIAEFARQWLLLSRQKPYEDGTGSHKLWMRAGSSQGWGGLYSVDVEEGSIGGDDCSDDGERIRLQDRKWEVVVTSAREAIAEKQNEKEIQKDASKERTVKRNGTKIIEAYEKLVAAGDHQEGWVSVRLLRDEAKLSGSTGPAAVNSLMGEGLFARDKILVPAGRGMKAEKAADAIRKKNYAGGE